MKDKLRRLLHNADKLGAVDEGIVNMSRDGTIRNFVRGGAVQLTTPWPW